ncbi:MAG TPA: hypothetical protein VE775_12380, partial [Pyrinomonadaceae bacterium]|nr:hypothetical protein [Pyrinomonadaceae bacterium]
MSGLAESAPPPHAPVAVSSSAGAAVASPYKGLIPYAEEDAPFFFGRDSEREIISANLLAARLTLLYGASGVGKSSVLRAGVIHHLRRRARQNLSERGTPEFGVVAFSAWRDYPLTALAGRINEQLAPLKVNDEDVAQFNPATQFAEFLAAWSRRMDGDILIILDQFEEYFLYHPQEDGPGTFAYEFPRALNRHDLRISFLLSLRDDAITRLDRFKGSIPSLFDNYLRIEHLDREAARAAIVEPVAEYNRRCTSDMQEVNIEPELVEAVLDQVRTGQVLLGEAGRGTQIIKGAAAEQIETPYLQLVLTRLWDEELRAGSHLLRRATLDRLGGAERIVRTHLDATMSALPMHEQDVAASVFHYLVTPSGTKIAHTVRDLSEYASRPAEVLEPVLEKLARTRILRSVAPPPHASAHGESDAADAPRYEIFHDVMAPAILDWRTRFKRTLAEHKASQRRRIILGFIIIGVLASVGLSVWQRFAAKKAELATIEAQRQAEEEKRKADVAQT